MVVEKKKKEAQCEARTRDLEISHEVKSHTLYRLSQPGRLLRIHLINKNSSIVLTYVLLRICKKKAQCEARTRDLEMSHEIKSHTLYRLSQPGRLLGIQIINRNFSIVHTYGLLTICKTKAQCEARTRDLEISHEIKSHTLYRLSQPGLRYLIFPSKNFAQ